MTTDHNPNGPTIVVPPGIAWTPPKGEYTLRMRHPVTGRRLLIGPFACDAPAEAVNAEFLRRLYEMPPTWLGRLAWRIEGWLRGWLIRFWPERF